MRFGVRHAQRRVEEEKSREESGSPIKWGWRIDGLYREQKLLLPSYSRCARRGMDRWTRAPCVHREGIRAYVSKSLRTLGLRKERVHIARLEEHI